LQFPHGRVPLSLRERPEVQGRKRFEQKLMRFFASKEESKQQDQLQEMGANGKHEDMFALTPETLSGACTVATAAVSTPDVTLAECAEEAAVDDDDIASFSAAVDKEDNSTDPFQWSNFRDKRLGRLVAEFRYDFGRAATALGKEFGKPVTEQECRHRYRELIRPSKTRAEMRADDRGRAKDGPAADPATVREITEWWLKRSSRLQGDKKADSAPRKEAAAAAAVAAADATTVQVPTEDIRFGAQPGSCAPDQLCDSPKPEANIARSTLAADKQSSSGLFELD